MSDASLERSLAKLRREYLADAPRRIADLWRAFARAQQGERDGLTELLTLFHRLAGTGGAYGLAAVTEQARAGEHAVHRLIATDAPASADVAALRQHVLNVADAFASAPDE